MTPRACLGSFSVIDQFNLEDTEIGSTDDRARVTDSRLERCNLDEFKGSVVRCILTDCDLRRSPATFTSCFFRGCQLPPTFVPDEHSLVDA